MVVVGLADPLDILAPKGFCLLWPDMQVTVSFSALFHDAWLTLLSDEGLLGFLDDAWSAVSSIFTGV